MIRRNKIKWMVGILILLILSGMAYRYSPYKLEYLGYYDKIWAHRANSEEKLKSALKFFKGIEVDLVYNESKNILDVTHPPVPSINLNLRQYLSNIPKDEFPYIWLDIKNLNIDNADVILIHLLDLFEEKQYPLEKILIETRYPEALPKFILAGFKTSFYLPHSLGEMSVERYNTEIQKIKDLLIEHPEMGISSNYIDYEIMAKEFPLRDKYFWITSSIRTHGFSKPRKILKDSTVKAVLISYKAAKGNR